MLTGKVMKILEPKVCDKSMYFMLTLYELKSLLSCKEKIFLKFTLVLSFIDKNFNFKQCPHPYFLRSQQIVSIEYFKKEK